MNKIVSFLYHLFLVVGFFIFLTACNQQPKPVFDINAPGAEVMASYNDSTPQVVFYYKVDEQGTPTQEKIGESYYYDNNQEYIGGRFKDGEKEGQWYAFFRDGTVQSEIFYVNGIEHGDYKIYSEQGKPFLRGHYNHGICDGTWYFYDENGKQTKRIIASKTNIACGYCTKCLKLKAEKKSKI